MPQMSDLSWLNLYFLFCSFVFIYGLFVYFKLIFYFGSDSFTSLTGFKIKF